MTAPAMAFDWRRLERDAREEAQRELAAIAAAPLEVGQHIAWIERSRFGFQMEDLSLVHRVAVPGGQKPETYCGEALPAAILRFTLTPRLIHTMPRCRWCEQAYTESLARTHAAGARATRASTADATA